MKSRFQITALLLATTLMSTKAFASDPTGIPGYIIPGSFNMYHTNVDYSNRLGLNNQLSSCGSAIPVTDGITKEASTFKYHGGGGGGTRFFFECNTGVSIPTGNFGTSDTLKSTDTTHMNGYAKLGWHFGLQTGVMIGDKITAELVFDEFLNYFNLTKFKSDAFGSQASSVTVKKSQNYYSGRIMVGGAYALALGSDKAYVDLRVLLGMMYVGSAEEDFFLPNGSSYINSNGGNAFSYDLGAIFRYEYNARGALTFGIGYLGTTGIKTIEGSGVSSSAFSYTAIRNVNMSVGEINFSIGFREYFSNK